MSHEDDEVEPDEDGSAALGPLVAETPDPQLTALLEHLREQRGFDFTGYKSASLARRIGRRMAAAGVGSYEDYQDRLSVDPGEFDALFDTVLINVTAFFRDADAWEHLRTEVLPRLLARRTGRLRVWSAACASGQEPYSLAVLLAEALGPEEFADRVKIYATDVDEVALATARNGLYDEREVAGVPEQTLARWFEPVGDRFQVRKELRRAVIFGRNDLIQDAPISHIDLLLCRNALMYFNAQTQAQIVRRLHFALEPHGVLFLGKAEMLLSHPDLFQPLELRRRFFRKVVGEPRRVAMPLTGAAPADAVPPEDLSRLWEEALLQAPAAQVVIGRDGVLVASNRRAQSLFAIGPRDAGRPFHDLEMSYKPVELRSSIEQVLAARAPLWLRDLSWQRVGQRPVSLDVQVVPLLTSDGEVLGVTVIFNDVTRYRELQDQLEQANQHLEAAYEELQSTNEELETMNEELQSTNDELNSSNEELRLRTAEVGELAHFLEAVLGGLRAGVAVLDDDLRVLAWNERAADLWGVRDDEALGRPMGDLDIGLPFDRLRPLLVAHANGLPAEDVVRVEAVNRRGRTVDLDVAVSPLRRGGAGADGAIVVMTVVG
ncbi:CheR family methyltransferase [Cellulomonas marina]|uniref:protein-glutamate O-methyltransferase n=1 Tax=Cellulomonas marina TaxID=988821 RepID=A0A1I1ADX5_9CELL|nr:CheR family methyltransferase [Cellulomonas marina]GIG29696.1 chemotaxis protein CheR [Cellulomonas marina]SFB36205.1 two-component system, chemotaxis family, CheB/CheR fusion protein [Cellulomonas marina]